MIKGQSWSLDS